MNTPNLPQPGTADLLRFADRIQGHARRLENLATWRDRLKRDFSAQQAGEKVQGADDVLRLYQALRDSGQDNGDAAFYKITCLGQLWGESISDTDPELQELLDKIRAIEKREGLPEDHEFDPDHPETPADWKSLNAKLHRRFSELEQIKESRFVRFLLAHGEIDMADLFANDRAAYDRRREAGRLLISGPLPEKDTDAMPGDTGVT